MSDGELIAFGKKKGPWLDDASFAMLQAEFVKRNLDDGVILAKEEKAHSVFATGKRKPFRFESADRILNPHWQYVIQEKEAGAGDGEIYQGLLHKGIAPTDASRMVEGVPEALPDIISHLEKRAWSALLLLAAGIGMMLLRFAWSGIMIPAFGPIIWGSYRLYKTETLKRKYTDLQQKWSEKG